MFKKKKTEPIETYSCLTHLLTNVSIIYSPGV